jgi:hypothetical protein
LLGSAKAGLGDVSTALPGWAQGKPEPVLSVNKKEKDLATTLAQPCQALLATSTQLLVRHQLTPLASLNLAVAG